MADEQRLATEVALLRQSIEVLARRLSEDRDEAVKRLDRVETDFQDRIAKMERDLKERMGKTERSINWGVLVVVGYTLQEILQAIPALGGG